MIVELEKYKLERMGVHPIEEYEGKEAVAALRYIANNTVIHIKSKESECDWVPAVYLGRMASTDDKIEEEDSYFFLLPGVALIEVIQSQMKTGQMLIKIGKRVEQKEFEDLMGSLEEWTIQVNTF